MVAEIGSKIAQYKNRARFKTPPFVVPEDKYYVIKNNKQQIWIHIIESIQENQAISTTSHPIEAGSVISDHRVIAPLSITMSGYILDHMFQATDEENVNVDLDWIARREALLQLQLSGELLVLQTPYKIYRNLQLINFSTDKTYQYDNGLKVKFTFKEMLISSTDFKLINEALIPVNRRKKKNIGKTSKAFLNPSDPKNQKIANKITGGV